MQTENTFNSKFKDSLNVTDPFTTGFDFFKLDLDLKYCSSVGTGTPYQSILPDPTIGVYYNKFKICIKRSQKC